MKRIVFFFFLVIIFVLYAFPKEIKAQANQCNPTICENNPIKGFSCQDPNCKPIERIIPKGSCYCVPKNTTLSTATNFLQFGKGCSNQWDLNTALGCIPTTSFSFVTWLLTFAIGIGGGIAFLLMLAGVFQIITSSGNPDKLKAGQELITSALIGLLMIIFSLFLLRFIGGKILFFF